VAVDDWPKQLFLLGDQNRVLGVICRGLRVSILRIAREYAGLSRRKMAEVLMVDESTLARCEIKKSKPTKKREAVTKVALGPSQSSNL
jgi:hypothetical protein